MSAAGQVVLLASVFYQRQEDGSRKRYRRGDSVTDLPVAVAERLRRIGAIGEPAAEPAAPAVSEGTGDGEPAGGAAKPGEDATKAELAAWLRDNAVKADGSDYSASELHKMKVADLRAIVDSIADED